MKFSLTVRGMEEVLEYVAKLERIKNPIMQGIRELIENAAEIVDRRYSLQGNGNHNYTIYVEDIPNGCRLIADGEDVGFLEFGAGVFTEADEFTQEVDYPVYAGSWSESHAHSDNPNARYFAKNGFWWYSNVRYTGLTPTRGMQQALDFLRANVEQTIKQKIDEWIGN